MKECSSVSYAHEMSITNKWRALQMKNVGLKQIRQVDHDIFFINWRKNLEWAFDTMPTGPTGR